MKIQFLKFLILPTLISLPLFHMPHASASLFDRFLKNFQMGSIQFRFKPNASKFYKMDVMTDLFDQNSPRMSNGNWEWQGAQFDPLFDAMTALTDEDKKWLAGFDQEDRDFMQNVYSSLPGALDRYNKRLYFYQKMSEKYSFFGCPDAEKIITALKNHFLPIQLHRHHYDTVGISITARGKTMTEVYAYQETHPWEKERVAHAVGESIADTLSQLAKD